MRKTTEALDLLRSWWLDRLGEMREMMETLDLLQGWWLVAWILFRSPDRQKQHMCHQWRGIGEEDLCDEYEAKSPTRTKRCSWRLRRCRPQAKILISLEEKRTTGEEYRCDEGRVEAHIPPEEWRGMGEQQQEDQGVAEHRQLAAMYWAEKGLEPNALSAALMTELWRRARGDSEHDEYDLEAEPGEAAGLECLPLSLQTSFCAYHHTSSCSFTWCAGPGGLCCDPLSFCIRVALWEVEGYLVMARRNPSCEAPSAQLPNKGALGVQPVSREVFSTPWPQEPTHHLLYWHQCNALRNDHNVRPGA
eukprot:c12894_g2_i1 orf=3-914(-)